MIESIAIIGLGSIGKRHLLLLREFRPEIKISAVRSGIGNAIPEEDITDEVLYSMDYAIESGVQAAIIATPASLHLEQSIKLIQAGIHILIEKPLSYNMDGIDQLISVSEKNVVVGLIGYVLRHDPAAIKFKEMLNSENTGQILHVNVDCGSYLPDWRPHQDYRQSVSARKELGGGVLLELSHELDYIRWFFGPFESITAVLNNSGSLGLEVEDSADLIINTLDGFPISVHLDFNSRVTRRSCVVHCLKGDLTWNVLQKTVSWQPADGSEKSETFNHDSDEIYLTQLQHFFDCMENNKAPAVSLEDGSDVLRIVEAARESSAKGKTVALA